jgi:hypothetical protein
MAAKGNAGDLMPLSAHSFCDKNGKAALACNQSDGLGHGRNITGWPRQTTKDL